MTTGRLDDVKIGRLGDEEKRKGSSFGLFINRIAVAGIVVRGFNPWEPDIN